MKIDVMGFIVKGTARSAIKEYETFSDRLMFIEMKAKPLDLFIIQIYAPNL